MAPRACLALLAPLTLGAALCAPTARGDEAATASRSDDGELAGPRVGFLPGVGVGVAQFTGQLPYFNSLVGMSISQLDFAVNLGKWGGFARGAYLSSGGDGRWTAPVAALGVTYRLKGDGEQRWGIASRAGLVYQRWHASTGGCPIPFFIPDNCKNFTPNPLPGVIAPVAPTYEVTIDNVGLLAGLSFEIPVESFFLALGTEVTGTVDVDHANPGLAFTGQLTFSFALRDHVRTDSGPQTITTHRYWER